MTTTNHTEHPLQVLVLGAGYAGLMAALRLAPHARVTLIDPSDRFTERVRLHELAAGRPDVTHPLSRFLRSTGVSHITARATAIDPVAREVTTDDGRRLPYDRLVYALGSRTAAVHAGERAHTPESAAALNKRLQDGPGSLAVVGGGLTGIELATELAESHPEWTVRLHSAGDIGEGLSARGRDHVRTVLGARGVRIEEGRRVTHADELDADAVVWAASMTPNSELAADAGLALDPSGRIAVDDALRSASHPEIYVAGDAAAAGSRKAGTLRMACATAIPTGAHAAASAIAESRGREPRPLDFRFFAQCVSLGRHDGLIQPVHADDTPHPRVLTGRPAALTKEQVVRSTVRFLSVVGRRSRRHSPPA
ncbi:NAD(P)/FAD-dependent oxidoreductase [Streptomyces sp. FIT100]|uniref:NAD(P)/FAD-dependent oxidoreductase n=1 Tax=Streptomyces sp. FIT100 TaxID=2837956 RepID=UPI0021C8442F|nr:FAD-dependent oxidoreductase [Streptomyces sp. FIT100]UUN28429.1 FAD-dependent oxidoreductase [Streptomyces sp. FIT100]